MEFLVGAGIALLAAYLGYLVRRWEHRREQRLDSYRSVLGAFHEAVTTGAGLLSTHTQIGFPSELDHNTWSDEAIQRMTTAHAEAWAKAAAARHQFEVAAFNVDLVGSERAEDAVRDLRSFLEEVLYSGVPWGYAHDYPSAGLNPVDIIEASMKRARPHVDRLARELWRSRR